MITVITKDCEDKGWWKGELDGKVGVFPDNFVKRVSQHLSPTETPEQMPDSPEKPKFQSLMTSPSRDNIKKLFENSGPSSVLSKATSFERLRVEKQEQNNKAESITRAEDEKKVVGDKTSSKSGIELNKKVANLKNELSKNELFNKPFTKVEPPVKSSPSRSSLDSVLSDKISKEKDSKRRTSEPAANDDLDDMASMSKLSHPTASRVKAPKRRPPSQHFLKENVSCISL